MFLQCWTGLLCNGLRDGDRIIQPVIELPHHIAANLVVREFMKGDCDTLLMLDDDMVFPASLLEDLRTCEPCLKYDILQALCVRRGDQSPVVLREATDDGHSIYIPRAGEIAIDADAVGMACTLIRRGVFHGLDSSGAGMWFYWPKEGQGEDGKFSTDAASAGAKIGVCGSVGVGHRYLTVWSWDTERGAPVAQVPVKQKNKE